MDVSFQYLTFFMEDDDYLNQIKMVCKATTNEYDKTEVIHAC